MPTGYTSELCEKPVTFEQFALRCAHAFTQHDESMPKRWKVDLHYEEEIEEAKREIARLEALSDEECDREARKKYERAKVKYEEAVLKREALRERLFGMKKAVTEWTPPTPDHRELKKFMLKQLDLTIDADARPLEPFEKHYLYVNPSGKEWRTMRLAEQEGELDYYEREHEGEVKEIARLNDWMDKLRASLK